VRILIFMHLRALLPILSFVVLFLGSGIYFSLQSEPMAFYKVSAVVCIMFALVVSVFLDHGKWSERVGRLYEGLANENTTGIIIIFLLAGGYSAIAKGSGCMQEVIAMTTHFFSPSYVLCGIFALSCIVGMALGTSMGVIGLFGPLAVEIAQGNVDIATWTLGAVVSGAAFGDNLSIISDTSIAAAHTIGVSPRAKFVENLKVAMCACLLVFVLYLCFDVPEIHYVADMPHNDIVWWRVAPYFLIILTAFLGVPVPIVLFGSIFLTGLLAVALSDYTLVGCASDWQKGMFSMMPITILTFLLGALQHFVMRQGGIKFLEKKYANPYVAALVIMKMGIIWTVTFANNTVAILFSGHSVRKITEKNDINPAFAASFLDMFATATKCIIPHGTQLLLAGSFMGISPLQIMPYCFYSFTLAFSALLFLPTKNIRCSATTPPS